MGEAKRRRELDLTHRRKRGNIEKSNRFTFLLPITKTSISKYPYMGVVTMALGAIIFLVSGGLNTIK